jgi:integrase
VTSTDVDEFTAGLLRRHWSRRQAQSGGWNADPNRPLFTHPDGRPLRPDWITYRLAELVEQRDLPPVRFHDLRHGAASLAGAANVPLKVIQHDLGHSSAVTTADTYWTVLQELVRRRGRHRPTPAIPRQDPHQARSRIAGVTSSLAGPALASMWHGRLRQL